MKSRKLIRLPKVKDNPDLLNVINNPGHPLLENESKLRPIVKHSITDKDSDNPMHHFETGAGFYVIVRPQE